MNKLLKVVSAKIYLGSHLLKSELWKGFGFFVLFVKISVRCDDKDITAASAANTADAVLLIIILFQNRVQIFFEMLFSGIRR